DIAILKAVIPDESLEDVFLASAGGRSYIASIARTVLATRQKPVAVVIDTDAVAQRLISEQVRTMQDLLHDVAAGVPTKVVPMIPEIETIFFQAPGLLPRIFGAPLSEEIRLLARFSPKEALGRLFQHSSGPKTIGELLNALDDDGIDSLRST